LWLAIDEARQIPLTNPHEVLQGWGKVSKGSESWGIMSKAGPVYKFDHSNKQSRLCASKPRLETIRITRRLLCRKTSSHILRLTGLALLWRDVRTTVKAACATSPLSASAVVIVGQASLLSPINCTMERDPRSNSEDWACATSWPPLNIQSARFPQTPTPFRSVHISSIPSGVFVVKAPKPLSKPLTSSGDLPPPSCARILFLQTIMCDVTPNASRLIPHPKRDPDIERQYLACAREVTHKASAIAPYILSGTRSQSIQRWGSGLRDVTTQWRLAGWLPNREGRHPRWSPLRLCGRVLVAVSIENPLTACVRCAHGRKDF
jgi:hypothetical protein